MSDIQGRLLAAFQIEHKEHLQAVRHMLTNLADAGFDVTLFDFTEAHRRVHTLKGAARAVGLTPVEAVAHRLETLMLRCQSADVALDQQTQDAIQASLDSIEDYVVALESISEPTIPEKILARLDDLISAERTAPAPTETGSARPEFGKGRAEPAGRKVAAAPLETVRIEVGKLDNVLKGAAEILAETPVQERLVSELRTLHRSLEPLRQTALKLSGNWGGDAKRALLEQIDALKGRAAAISRLQDDATWRFGRLGRRLHRDVGQLRVVTAETVFEGVRKMVRDLANAENKQIEVEIAGLETRADRQVLQQLKDPVLHLLRNAVSHGIEMPEVRRAQGKSPQGRIRFDVAAQRGRLEILIEDDGRGLDRARIQQEAARRGLLPPEAGEADRADTMMQILLQPGFSTAPSVTELAGRGIGLSIVDKAVRFLHGRFILSDALHAGAAAHISVPLSIAGSRVLLVRCGQNIYALPADSIQRLYRLPAGELVTVRDAPAIRSDDGGEPIPLRSLAQLLRGEDSAVSQTDGAIFILVLSPRLGRLALAVDGFLAVQDCLIHDLDPVLPDLSFAAGAVILVDGTVSIVINLVALLRAARDTRHQWSFEAEKPIRGDTAPLVLVVDDSITTRTLEKSILEARGFDVRLSVDGLDALDQLRRQRPDLVIADIEMPRMDGFELLHAMKGEADLAAIPVVLVTSRDDPQDRRKGLALGAAAYIVKQRFDQTALLETIDQIL